jgi:hypothetical protein
MTLKSEPGQIELINEQIDHTHKVIFPDPLVQTLRKQRRLIPADTFDETCHPNPPNHGQA